MKDYLRKLSALGACPEALEWAQTQPDPQTAWDECERPDWLLWLLGRATDDKRPFVQLAVRFARDVLPLFEARHPEDKRPRLAVETAEAWLRGEATAADARAAAAYADAARADAYVYTAAAGAAAYAYAAAAAAAGAAGAARAAAAYAYAAAADAAAADAYAARKKQAAAIREIFPSVPQL